MSLYKNASCRTRKSRSSIGLRVLSALVKKYTHKVKTPKQGGTNPFAGKFYRLSEEDIEADGELRCPGCNKLHGKIKIGALLRNIDNDNPPIIEMKCTRTHCKEIVRYMILKENEPIDCRRAA